MIKKKEDKIQFVICTLRKTQNFKKKSMKWTNLTVGMSLPTFAESKEGKGSGI